MLIVSPDPEALAPVGDQEGWDHLQEAAECRPHRTLLLVSHRRNICEISGLNSEVGNFNKSS
jgi:hypothetical protein